MCPRSISPIANLPAEMVLEIFRASLELRESGLPLLERSGSRGEGQTAGRLFLYSQVCRLWRAIVLSSPDLWNSLLFNHQHLSIGNGVLTGAKNWFDISAPLPMDIFLHFEAMDVESATNVFLIQSLFAFLKTYAGRLRRLSLQLPTRKLLSHAAELLLLSSPFLEDVRLNLPGSESVWMEPQYFTIPFAPRLSVLRCIGWKAFYVPTACLSSLRELRFDHYVPHSLAWKIISNAPLVDTVQMGLAKDGSLCQGQDLVSTFPRMRNLDLRARDHFEDDLDPLFDRLSAPNLEALSLSVSTIGLPTSTSPVRLKKFLEASAFPHVTRLYLHNISLSPTALTDIFNLLPRVTTLSLSGASLSVDTLSLLSVSPQRCVVHHRPCLPCLQILILDLDGHDQITSVEAYLTLLRGRLFEWCSGTDSPIVNLQRLFLVNCLIRTRLYLKELDVFSKYQASGLNFSSWKDIKKFEAWR